MNIIDIYEEHLEEGDFLWCQRQNALGEDIYDLPGLAEMEERLLAHLDGLVIAGDAAKELLTPLLTKGDAGEAFTAGAVALASGDAAKQDALVQSFGEAGGETLIGLCSACQLAMPPGKLEALRELVSEVDGEVAAAVLDVLSFQRTGLSSPEVAAVLESDDTLVQAAGLRAAGRLGLLDLAGQVRNFLDHEDLMLRDEARHAAFLFNDPAGQENCRQDLKNSEAGSGLIWLGLGGDCSDGELLAPLLSVPELARPTVVALGWLGDPARLDGLIQCASEADLARQVGLAWQRITGLDLAVEGLLDLAEPSETEDSKVEDSGEDFEEDPDEGLPRPDPNLLNSWWQKNRSRFSEGTRYRHGQPLDHQVLRNRLQQAGLYERHLAAGELTRLVPGKILLETRALAPLQLKALAGLD